MTTTWRTKFDSTQSWVRPYGVVFIAYSKQRSILSLPIWEYLYICMSFHKKFNVAITHVSLCTAIPVTAYIYRSSKYANFLSVRCPTQYQQWRYVTPLEFSSSSVLPTLYQELISNSSAENNVLCSNSVCGSFSFWWLHCSKGFEQHEILDPRSAQTSLIFFVISTSC